MLLVKQAKAKLASQGLTWYESKVLGRVPLETVEEILGVKIDEEDFNKPVEALIMPKVAKCLSNGKWNV